MPGSILDIISMVDNDPRLASLHNIDPTIAFREAKNLWLEKTGISTPPLTPKSTNVSGGIQKGTNDLGAVLDELETVPAGSKRFYELIKKKREIESRK
jgi:hypothetical protein